MQEQQQESIQMSGMVLILLKKNEGNKFFAQKDYKKASECYELALESAIIQCKEFKDLIEKHQNDEKQKQVFQAQYDSNMQMVGLLQNNLAAVYTETLEYDKCIEICNEILKDFPNSVKAIFRRGVAYLQTHRIIEANEDLKNALKLSPKNPEILKVIDVANKRLQDPLYLNEIVRKGGIKLFINDPFIIDPLQEQQQKEQSKPDLDKKFELNGVRDFDLKKAKAWREHFPKSIDMLKQSVIEDSWKYVDKQVVEDFGFKKFEQSQWFLLFGIYQTLFIYKHLKGEDLDKAREDGKIDELFEKYFDEQGFFNYDKRKIQCLYYTKYLESGIKIDKN